MQQSSVGYQRQALFRIHKRLITNSIPLRRREQAKQLVNSLVGENMSESSSSAEYAYDFLDSASLFGSQLNLRTISSEFDDLPGYVAGKVLYFVKGVTVQPFSVRKKYIYVKQVIVTYDFTIDDL